MSNIEGFASVILQLPSTGLQCVSNNGCDNMYIRFMRIRLL